MRHVVDEIIFYFAELFLSQHGSYRKIKRCHDKNGKHNGGDDRQPQRLEDEATVVQCNNYQDLIRRKIFCFTSTWRNKRVGNRIVLRTVFIVNTHKVL